MPRHVRLILAASIVSAGLAAPVQAESLHGETAHGAHHLSVFVGVTDLKRKPEPMAEGEGEPAEAREDDTAATFALDYEYRVSPLLGLGAVIEQTTGSFDATTLLAVADIHIAGGFVIQVGPGAEFAENDATLVGRIGGLYEFEFGCYTVSPQAHYDITGKEDSKVFGIAFGMNF